MLKNIGYIFLFLLITSSLTAQTKEETYQMIVEGIGEMNLKNHTKSLEILTEAKTIAEANKWHRENFLALNNIGLNYYLMLDYGEALNNLFNAYLIALKDLDRDSEMVVLNNIAIIYLKDDRLTKAESYFEDAYTIALELQDTLKMGIYSLNLASVSNELKKVKKAEKLLQTASGFLAKDSILFPKVILTRADNLLLKNQYREAASLIQEYIPEISEIQQEEDRFTAWFIMAKIYEGKADWDQAISAVEKVKNDSRSTLENKKDAFRRLSELHRHSGNLELAIQFKDSLIQSKDSLNRIKNGKLFENSRIKFELENYQKELFESRRKLQKEKQKLYMILGIIVLVLLLIFWMIRNYYLRLKKDRIIAENNHKIAELELGKEKNEKLILEKQLNEQRALVLLEKERFKNEIEKKNRKLTTKALSISTRNELIEDIVETLSESKEVFQNESLKKTILKLKKHLSQQSEWEDFFTHFEEVNQGFIENLKQQHPDLNSNDIRFLSYEFMNLSTKEIASLFNITAEACRKRRERIIKKMNLEPQTSLFDYLTGI